MGLVLIIEDDESVAKAIAEVCVGLGLETATAKTGPLAIQAFMAQPPNLVTLDMLLPGGMDGTRVADEIRKLMGGESVPIVVVTGVLKNPSAQRELQTRAGVRSFVMKPFKADELRAAIAGPLGIAVQAEPQAVQARAGMASFEGELGMMPAMQLFADLHRNKAEGVLELTRGQVKKRFFIQRGFFRYATSNVKAETVTGLLQARGVPEARLNDAMAVMKAQSLSLPDALVQVGLTTPKDLPALLTQQTEEVAITTAAWPDGHVSFKANPLPPGLEGRANPLHCILKAVKRYESPEQARAAIQPLGKTPLERTPELDREGFAIRAIFTGEAVTPMINGRTAAMDILQKAKPQDLLLVHALMTAGLVKARTTPLTAPNGLPAAVASKGPRRQYTEEEEANRTIIAGEARRQEGCTTHYQVLGVDPRADLATVKASYLRMAKRFHTDVYAGQELGDLAQTLQDNFRRISEAGNALGDENKRKDYDVYLDRKARGLPTDVNEMMRAEGAYNRAESLKLNGRLRDAEKLYREAASIDAGQVTYLLGLAHAVYKLNGKPGAKESMELLDKAAKLGQELPPALLLRAQLLLEAGDYKAALEAVRKVTTTNPGYEGAMDLLRQVKAASQAPAAADKGGGIFGKLFGTPDKKK